MKLSEFSKPAPPVYESVPTHEPSVEAPQEEQYTTSVTPNGKEIYYSWAPRRHYKLRYADSMVEGDVWREVPSVTKVLGVLEKPQLVWWGMKVGVEGVVRLCKEHGEYLTPKTTEQFEVDSMRDALVEALTEHKLTVNHQRDKAADRGVNVHEVLDHWKVGMIPDPELFPETERGYVKGLRAFMDAIDSTAKSSEGEAVTESELMVGSLEHSYAGRFDLVLTLSKAVEVVTKTYPKRKPKVEEIPAGRYLLDLKTSKGVYNTHYLQLEAYEAAAVECGYEPTDHRGVIHVTADGRYELALNKDWCFDDFLAVRRVYSVLNEREVLRVLREDLDATEVME